MQDFTPTPMTLATVIYYSGYHPYTMEKVFTAKNKRDKLSQRQFFFWYKNENRKSIINELKSRNREDMVEKIIQKKTNKHRYIKTHINK